MILRNLLFVLAGEVIVAAVVDLVLAHHGADAVNVVDGVGRYRCGQRYANHYFEPEEHREQFCSLLRYTKARLK